MVAPPKLTNLQLELLQIFSYTLPDEQLIEVRQLLARYFLEKADTEMDKLWREKGWNEDTVEMWIKGHDRTPPQLHENSARHKCVAGSPA